MAYRVSDTGPLTAGSKDHGPEEIAMRGIPLCSLLCALALGCGGAEENPADAVMRDVAAIRALIDRAQDANNAGDIIGWVELFEEGAVYMPPGMDPVTTRQGLEDAAVSGFSRYRSNIRIAVDEIEVLGDWAFARTTITGTATPYGDGNPVVIDVKALQILRRQPDGGWKVSRYINNRNG
jgi:uncharacterized protein (TIGR02246 family)